MARLYSEVGRCFWDLCNHGQYWWESQKDVEDLTRSLSQEIVKMNDIYGSIPLPLSARIMGAMGDVGAGSAISDRLVRHGVGEQGQSLHEQEMAETMAVAKR
jgi:hypothetical protein